MNDEIPAGIALKGHGFPPRRMPDKTFTLGGPSSPRRAEKLTLNAVLYQGASSLAPNAP